MPYDASGEGVPESVPQSKKKQFAAVFNEVYERTQDEGRAMAAAWSAIKKAFDEEDIEKEELEKAGRRHSKTDMAMFDKVKAMMGEMMAMMDELRGKEMENEDMKHEDMEKRDVDPNVGEGNVDRDELKPGDFIDPEHRRFPVMTPGDVSDAVSSFGRMGEPKMPFDEFKRKLIALCRRKGFMDSLPAEWKEEMKKNIVVQLEKMVLEKQLIYGVVLKPAPFVDSQGDMVDEAEIEQAAHDYLETYRMYDLQHTVALSQDAVVPVESYIAPQDLLWDTPQGRKLVPKGSWVLVSHVVDPMIWEQVKQGNVNAYSIAGYCQAREVVNA